MIRAGPRIKRENRKRKIDWAKNKKEKEWKYVTGWIGLRRKKKEK